MVQSKGHWPSEEPETLGETREGCVVEEALQGPGAWVGMGCSERPGRACLAKRKKKKRHNCYTIKVNV